MKFDVSLVGVTIIALLFNVPESVLLTSLIIFWNYLNWYFLTFLSRSYYQTSPKVIIFSNSIVNAVYFHLPNSSSWKFFIENNFAGMKLNSTILLLFTISQFLYLHIHLSYNCHNNNKLCALVSRLDSNIFVRMLQGLFEGLISVSISLILLSSRLDFFFVIRYSCQPD